MSALPSTVGELAVAAGASFGTSGVRGRVADLSPAICHAYVQAFLGLSEVNERSLLIGHDLRPSSPGLAAYCHQSARQAGWQTRHAGTIPTPALAYAAQELGLPAIMITGSHIPFDRNGIKFYHSNGEITKADEQRILSCPLPSFPLQSPSSVPDAEPAILENYLQRYRDAFPPGSLSGLRIGVFEHSSVARDILHVMLRSLGAETISLGRSDDFVAVDTEAVRQEDVKIAPVWAKQYALHAIVTTDGDADRPLIADERGRWIRGDVLGILCARDLGARSVVTPVSSNTALERSGLFECIIRTRIGSPHVIAAMDACGACPVVGYEANGGFLLGGDVDRDGMTLRSLKTRDAMLPIVLALAASRREGVPLSSLFASFPNRHTASDRLKNVNPAACQNLIDELDTDTVALRALLAPDAGDVISTDRTDGLRVFFSNGEIVHLRLSGNAPELRCYSEATTSAQADQLCRDCLARLAERLG